MDEEDAPTLAETVGDGAAARGPLDARLEDRYEIGKELGRGGMGEVRLAYDTRVNREVAVKVMRPEQRDDDTIARFFREARVQGRLDHPAVAPVHDLGIDRGGNPYFVMKRLAGITLAEVLAGVIRDPVMREKWPRRQLLARLVDVCLAVERAHTRDVVHRDLKPANIMFGDFGEVYVLDWGLARVVADPRRSRPIIPLPGDSGAAHTVAGALLGTPGYMPPEQIRGAAIDGRADVYALGCILYEIVTEHAALPHGMEAIPVTLDTECHRPSARFGELAIPPELDDLCARATASDPVSRPTARQLGDAIQRYLDGDRDLAQRRELASTHAVRAREALALPGDEARARAMHEAGRALVLDANNLDAQGVLAHLMLETPNAIPDEARAEADAERSAILETSVRWLARGYTVVVLAMIVLFLVVLPVRHLTPIVFMIGLTAATNVALWLAGWRPLPLRSPWFVVVLWLNCAALVASGIVVGPLLMVPIFLIGTLSTAFSQPFGFSTFAIVLPYTMSFAAPLVLEWVGVLPSTYRVEHHALMLTPWAVNLTPAATIALMLIGITAQAVITSSLMRTQTRAQQHARDLLHAQAWHLKQLLPRRSADHAPKR